MVPGTLASNIFRQAANQCVPDGLGRSLPWAARLITVRYQEGMGFLHIWNNDIHIHGRSGISMELNSQPAGNQIANPMVCQQTGDGLCCLCNRGARSLPQCHRVDQGACIHLDEKYYVSTQIFKGFWRSLLASCDAKETCLRSSAGASVGKPCGRVAHFARGCRRGSALLFFAATA